MIPKMKKFLFAGAKDDMDAFFSRAQEMGQMEFISLTSKKPESLPDSAKQIIDALKILKKQPVCTQAFASYFDAKTKVKNILFHQKEIENFHEKMRILKAEIARIQPFGEFSLKDIGNLRHESHKSVQFFVARHSKLQDAVLPDSVIYINSEFDQDYFLYVGDGPLHHPLLTEIIITTSLEDLNSQYDRVREKSEKLERELKELAAYIHSIQEALAEELNRIHLQQAKNMVDFQVEGFIFFIEAWIPENKVATILALIDGLAVVSEEVAIESTDVIPTYMENQGFAAIGEDLVNVYDTPAITDKDPSAWVIWAFALFFAMIVADAGYGFIYLMVAITLWVKFPKWTGHKLRLKKLITILSSFCILWGVLIGSYFSIQISPENSLNKVSGLYYLATKKVDYHLAVKDDTYQDWLTLYPEISGATTPLECFTKGVVTKGHSIEYKLLGNVYDTLLLEIALIVGMIHLSLSLLRSIRKNVSGAGWLMFIAGGYLYFPSLLGADSLMYYLGIITPEVAAALGWQLLAVGTVFAIIAAVVQERLGGLGEILKSIQIFADALSYLRLYALGMASMIMAVTFNELGEMVGLTFGIFIIIIGHMVNITIGIMGGVIHGLRLNFLEWYHYCFEGGGKAFKPLKIIKM